MKAKGPPAYRLELRDSAIHGRGCYAGEPIPAGAFIIEYTGERISAEEAYRREADPDRPGIYTFWTGDEGAIDGYRGGNAARFINHCCTPNCDYRIADRRVLIHAAHDIAEGEELADPLGDVVLPQRQRVSPVFTQEPDHVIVVLARDVAGHRVI